MTTAAQKLISRVPIAARERDHFGIVAEVHEAQVVAHFVWLVAAIVVVLQTQLSPLVVP